MEVSDTLYSHLRALAGRCLQSRPGHTLKPTELVAEAYLELGHKGFEGRGHFMAVAARTMRGIPSTMRVRSAQTSEALEGSR